MSLASTSSFPPNPLTAPPPASTQPRTSTPFISDLARTPYLAWGSSALLLSAIPATVRSKAGFPHLMLLPAFAGIFGFSGYMTSVGDSVNGAGTTTAWSLTYLFLNARRAIVSKRPFPITLSSAIAASAIIHGVDYFSNA